VCCRPTGSYPQTGFWEVNIGDGYSEVIWFPACCRNTGMLDGAIDIATVVFSPPTDLVHGVLHLIAGSAGWAGLPGIVSMDDLIGTHCEGTGGDLDDNDMNLAEVNEVGLRRRAASGNQDRGVRDDSPAQRLAPGPG
jgi:hypothetical protein